MSDVICRTCGERNCRVDAPIVVGEATIGDSYCGVGGVNWGRYSKQIAEARKGKARMPKRGTRDAHSL